MSNLSNISLTNLVAGNVTFGPVFDIYTPCHLRCVTTANVQLPSIHRIPTHTNGSKAIILPCYYSGNQVMWYVPVDKYRLPLI